MAKVQLNLSTATRAAAERAVPSACGAAAGVVAAVWAPDSAGQAFYSAAAQVLPVILLALAIEARVFGLGSTWFPVGETVARRIVGVRRLAEIATILALVAAEWQAFDAIVQEGNEADPWVVYLGLAWGFVMAGVLPLVGVARARVTIATSCRVEGSGVVLTISLDNRYGEKSISPMFNLLVPKGHIVASCEEDGSNAKKLETLTVTGRFGGEAEWAYVWKEVVLTPGNALFGHYVISHNSKAAFPVIVRLDHPELPGGRVEKEDCLQVADP